MYVKCWRCDRWRDLESEDLRKEEKRSVIDMLPRKGNTTHKMSKSNSGLSSESFLRIMFWGNCKIKTIRRVANQFITTSIFLIVLGVFFFSSNTFIVFSDAYKLPFSSLTDWLTNTTFSMSRHRDTCDTEPVSTVLYASSILALTATPLLPLPPDTSLLSPQLLMSPQPPSSQHTKMGNKGENKDPLGN